MPPQYHNLAQSTILMEKYSYICGAEGWWYCENICRVMAQQAWSSSDAQVYVEGCVRAIFQDASR
jgi:hypothetical protein